MKDRPILFSTPMVKAILADEKTKTRRVVKPQPLGCCLLRGPNSYGTWEPYTGRPDIDEDAGACAGRDEWVCPYGKPGDRLWVRETFAYSKLLPQVLAFYKTDVFVDTGEPLELKWRPSIHMPRWASRITLEVAIVKVERAQDITDEDVIAEGVFHRAQKCTTPRIAFAVLWDSINAKRGYGWDVNPWVWVVEFKRVPQP